MSESASSFDVESDESLLDRIVQKPRPALLWSLGLLVLLALEIGAFVDWLPHLLSRELIPNQGYYNGQEYVGTFLGLEPKYAWLVRFTLVYAYAAVFLGWCWYAYILYRRHYRIAGWTPTDDVIDRLRTHRWGQFGLVVVLLFLVLAIWAPVVGPTTLEQNIVDPYSHEMQYWDAESESVETILVGEANIDAKSKGDPENNVGPWSYDDHGRFHPFGTLRSGKDLFTFLAFGARISLLIGVASTGIAGGIALFLSLLTAYYKGIIDLMTVLASDSVQALPRLLIIILAAVVFRNHWLASIYNGALLLTLFFGLTGWPGLWRAVRGPALQVSEEEWIDAAKSYGQHPLAIMRKHMAPYVIGYLLIYASLSLAGIIIGVAALSFLSLGVTAPTPEWGRAVNQGRDFVATSSWHIALIPGILITLVATGFNAFGDGIRDAIDPKSDSGESGEAAAAAGGGGA